MLVSIFSLSLFGFLAPGRVSVTFRMCSGCSW
jgi:hypothetical protein